MATHPYDLFIDRRFEPLYREQPLALIDVGARGGLRSNWAAARPYLRMIGFEPDQQEHARLADRSQGTDTTYFGVALSNRTGPLDLHVARDRGLSSIFEPDRDFIDRFPESDRFDTVGVERVAAERLDNLIDSQQISDVDFIKVDTQGSELFVLEGARHALTACGLGVEAEAEFTPIYKGQPLFADMDAFLRGLGYHLFDLRPCFWKRAAGRHVGGPRGQIIWADTLYLKGLPALQDTVSGMEPARRKAKALKAITVSLLYGYCDYALEIARALEQVFTVEEQRVIERRLLALEPGGRAAKDRRRGRVTATLRRLSKRVKPRPPGWSISNANLGNLR